MTSRPNKKATTSGQKTAQQITCFKCKTVVDIKSAISCTVCKHYYEFDCAGVSEKLYGLKNMESKRKWKCKLCIDKYEKNKVSPADTNVTIRKKPLSLENKNQLKATKKEIPGSYYNIENSPTVISNTSPCSTQKPLVAGSPSSDSDDTCDESSSSQNLLSMNLLSKSADTSINQSNTIREMKETISQLTTALDSTQNELDTAILENNELQRQIKRLNLEKTTLQSLCYSAGKGRQSCNNGNAKKRHSLMFPIGSSTPSAYTSGAANAENTEEGPDADVRCLQRRVLVLEEQLKEAAIENINLEKKLDILSQKLQLASDELQSATKVFPNIRSIELLSSRPRKMTSTPSCGVDLGNNSQNKLCVISSNKRNKILNIALNTLSDDFQICHYLTPNSGIEELFQNIHLKTATFTKDDYCVILIGEVDFMETRNYSDLVHVINVTLSKLLHTNFIVCLPTFKLKDTGAMYNSRIETFNNLLYLNNLRDEYSFVADSNMQLSFSYEMFHRVTGTINNTGIRRIFQGIKETIHFIQGYNNALEGTEPFQMHSPGSDRTTHSFRQ